MTFCVSPFLKATSILRTARLPHHLNSLNFPGWRFLFFFSHKGASLPGAAEFCWQEPNSAHNSSCRTSYGRALSQSPSPIYLKTLHLLNLNNISQVSLLHTLKKKPTLCFYYMFHWDSICFSCVMQLFLRCKCWESNEKSGAKCAACAWRVVSKYLATLANTK